MTEISMPYTKLAPKLIHIEKLNLKNEKVKYFH